MLVIPGQARPRLWLRLLPRVLHNIPFSVTLRGRLDVFPFNKFVVGGNSILESGSNVNNGVGDVFIGKGVTLGIGSVIIGPATIGDDVIIAQHVVMSGLNHLYEDISKPISKQGTVSRAISIGSGSWVGANVCVSSGVEIGRNCVVGAGSVVVKSIPDYCVAVGNPARIVKKYDPVTAEWIKIE